MKTTRKTAKKKTKKVPTKKGSAPALGGKVRFSIPAAKVRLAKVFPTPTMGTDPEFFIRDMKNRPIPADLVLGKNPGIGGSGYENSYGAWKVIIDTACGEFTTPVGSCLQELNGNIGVILQEIFASKLYPKYDFLITPAAKFDEDLLDKSETAHTFGCAPSLVRMPDGSVRQSSPKISPHAVPIRSAGYHVHLGNPLIEEGYEDDGGLYDNVIPRRRRGTIATTQATVDKALHRLFRTPEGHMELVQTCDLMVGLPSVLLERQYEQGRWRRMTLGYGRAGEFRVPKHGFEYRTLSMWPLSSPVWTWWAHCMVRDAYRVAAAGLKLYRGIDMAAVSEAIDQHKFDLASSLWLTVRKRLARLCDKGIYYKRSTVAFSLDSLKGMEFIMAHGGFLSNISSNVAVEWELASKGGGHFYSDESVAYGRGFPSFVANEVQSDPRWNKFNKNWKVNSNNVKDMVVA